MIIRPLTDMVYPEEDCLEEKEEESHPDHLAGDHQDEMGPVCGLFHQPYLHE